MKKLETINPQKYSYAFNLGKYDCFKRLTGKCSLELTDEEYEKYVPLSKGYSDGSVDYCREFAEYLKEKNAFEKDTGIYAVLNDCGHVAFDDGQHRTCIAKKLGIEKLVVSEFSKNPYECRVCYFKQLKQQNNNAPLLKKLINKIKNYTNKDSVSDKFIDDEFIDDDLNNGA
ncbi:hypothetical protein [Bacillus marasmi]|uniref:hypothetical protein n=1 Tax=Bacillus marasmi TaxID=1926279 RepID=UPI001FE4EBCF|nr:hypothetical protein [Bacillus marasmi]